MIIFVLSLDERVGKQMSWPFINYRERGRISKLIYKGLISSLTYKSTRNPDNKLSALITKGTRRRDQTTLA